MPQPMSSEKKGSDRGALKPLALDGGHSIGENIQLVVYGQLPAQLQSSRQENGPFPQGLKVGNIKRFRIGPFTGDGEVTAETLHQQVFLGAAAQVKFMPELGVALVVELIALLREGEAVFPA